MRWYGRADSIDLHMRGPFRKPLVKIAIVPLTSQKTWFVTESSSQGESDP